MSSGVITISPLSEAGAVPDDVVAMVVAASLDPAIRDETYLVQSLDETCAREYCKKSDGVVVRLDGVPVGVSIVHHTLPPLQGIEIPAGCVELEQWILAPFRGRGLMGRHGSWPLVAAWLAQRFERLLGVAFVGHAASQGCVRSCGWNPHGRGYLNSNGIPGYRSGECDVSVYELAPHRVQP
jgi:hypothetical protein